MWQIHKLWKNLKCDRIKIKLKNLPNSKCDKTQKLTIWQTKKKLKYDQPKKKIDIT